MALKTYLTGIADAIREKKGTTDPINAQDFASEISSISTGGGGTGDDLWDQAMTARLNDLGPSLSHLFYQWRLEDYTQYLQNYNTQSVKFAYDMFSYSLVRHAPYFDTSSVQDMNHMFYYCQQLTTLPQLDTSKVTNMSYMFYNCQVLTTIPQLDTSNVTNMNYMFGTCYKLTTVPQLDTSSATNMMNMFRQCYSLSTIDITKLVNSNTSFAASCYSLTKLIIRTMDTIPTYGGIFYSCYHFTGNIDLTYNPDGLQDGRIYVPDDKVDALKAATGWAAFADIIVPLSTLVED